MPETWPLTLPQSPLISGFELIKRPNTIRSDVDVGRAKVRRRYTKKMEDMQCSFLMTQEQWNIFDAFFETTLNGGVNTFNFTHPWTGETLELRSADAPKSKPASLYIMVTWSLEIMNYGT